MTGIVGKEMRFVINKASKKSRISLAVDVETKDRRQTEGRAVEDKARRPVLPWITDAQAGRECTSRETAETRPGQSRQQPKNGTRSNMTSSPAGDC